MSYYAGYTLGSWNAKVFISGEGLEDPIQTATTAVHGLWLVSLVAVAIWAALVGRKATPQNVQSVSKVYILWVAIFIAIM